MTKRRVLGITGIRSEYFLQRPIFLAVDEHPDLELELIVSGAHLSPMHGFTADTVESDGFKITDRIESLLYSNRDASRLKGLALQLQVLAHIVDSRRPDWLLVPADREEAITLALCGSYLGIPMAHYGAGDRTTGNVDDFIRHSVSRIAHLLMTTNEDAKTRLISAGEEEWRVHNVGHSGVDRIRQTPKLDFDSLATELHVTSIRPPYLVVIQHPLSSEIAQSGFQMSQTLEAVLSLNYQTFVSYPNSDSGSHDIIAEIEGHRHNPNLHIFKTLPDIPFVNLLRGAALLVGNSSLGILEAPYLRLPAINVGFRQEHRHHSENVFFVPHNKQHIVDQITSILTDDSVRQRVKYCNNPFGDGHTGDRVAKLLAETTLDNKLMNKQLTY